MTFVEVSLVVKVAVDDAFSPEAHVEDIFSGAKRFFSTADVSVSHVSVVDEYSGRRENVRRTAVVDG